MLTIKERTFPIEHVFWANDKYTEDVKEKFSEKFPISLFTSRYCTRSVRNNKLYLS